MKQFQNALYYGDNLDILRKFGKDESVDLCYIDPPFNSKRDYFQIYNGIGQEIDQAQAKAFVDTWTWDVAARNGYEEIIGNTNGRFNDKTINLFKGLNLVLGEKDMLAYLVHITLRAQEIHRILKPTGSFFLHCDPTASHYLKIMLDTIFVGQGGSYINEIIWCYTGPSATKTRLPKKHDVIHAYSKSANWKFNMPRIAHKSGIHNSGQVFGDTSKSDEKAVAMKEAVKSGKKCEDFWIDIYPTDRMRSEMLGYPTQKPKSLLKRVIEMATDEGDVVLDAYCGCGTTVEVAQLLKRQWIGIDITYQSISLIKDRMANSFPKEWPQISQTIFEHGMPRDDASLLNFIDSPNDRLHKELEKWSILTFSGNRARINDKKGGDGGVDGSAGFITGIDMNTGQSTFGKVLFQTKCNRGTPEQVRAFRTNMKDGKADLGFFLHHGKPTPQMREMADKEGYYTNPLFPDSPIKKIQFVSLSDIAAGKRMDLPQARILSPIKHAIPEGDKNADLFGDTE